MLLVFFQRKNISVCRGSHSTVLLCFLIGTVMTPNYIDSSSLSVAPWCDCSNSGNDIDECRKFLNFFQDNTCLKNAIQAFGNGTDVNVWQPILPVQTTTATTTTASRLKNIGSETTNNEIPTHNDSPACANLQIPIIPHKLGTWRRIMASLRTKARDRTHSSLRRTEVKHD
ncbi:GDNF family receptor alpha-1-like [Meleagris gallopavo]|uniref:GDNF family receptor alpha-1-like n=1 Tax=Meleagris gallopavo TaxID=9103 RepID=UPI0012AC40CF|nr:GDNF family receptor alpha-1-like [Meleagris gallopavo]